MKHICSIIFLLLILSLSSHAQAPQGFNYQAVIRDGNGDIMANANVTMRFTLTTAIFATIKYQETHSLVTNEFGLLNCVVGFGTVLQGNMTTVDWHEGNRFLKVEADTGGGFVNMGIQQMMSVPYALSSGDAIRAWGTTGNEGTNSNENFIGTTDAHAFNIKTNDIDRMYFSSNSNTTQVGIGTKAPGTVQSSFGTSWASGNLLHVKDSMNSSRIILDFNNDEFKNQLTFRVDEDASTIRSSGGIPLLLTSALEEGLYIHPDGNVGIYTETPYTKLHIVGGSDASLTAHGYLITGDVDDNNIVMDTNEIMARNDGATSPLFINGNGGNVAIGQTSTPLWQLTVNGTAAKAGGGSWASTSDARLKENVQPFTQGLNEVLKVEPITYHYIAQTGHDTTVEHVGVIAQDLQRISASMVNENEMELTDGTKGTYLSVDSSAFTYMLINAVQELKMENEKLTSKMEAQQKQIDALLHTTSSK